MTDTKWYQFVGKNPKCAFLRTSAGYGVEVELENVPDVFEYLAVEDAGKCLWKITSDGSLRNHGVEFVSEPFPINHAVDFCSALDSFLTGKWEPEASGRCGVHVHVNIAHATPETIIKYLLLAMLFEPVIFNFTGERGENRFCVPASGSDAISFVIAVINDCLKHGNVSVLVRDILSLSSRLAENSKYSAINVMPMYRQNTIEFRHSKSVFPTCDYIPELVGALHTLLEFATNSELIPILLRLLEVSNDSEYVQICQELFGINVCNSVDFNKINKKLRENLRKYKAEICFKSLGVA